MCRHDVGDLRGPFPISVRATLAVTSTLAHPRGAYVRRRPLGHIVGERVAKALAVHELVVEPAAREIARDLPEPRLERLAHEDPPQ